jgi:hypothetical protein
MTASIEDRLKMTHLDDDVEDLEDLKKQIDAEKLPPTSKEEEIPDEETWTFQLAFTDTRGVLWAGEFTTTILDLETQRKVAIMRSRLQGGMPIASIDVGIIDMNLVISHMTFALTHRPQWAKDLLKLKDAEIVYAIWEKVKAHENRYFRRPEDPSES